MKSQSSHLPHFSLDKFLHPSVWLRQQKSVCVFMEGSYNEPCSSPGRNSILRFTLLWQGCLMSAAFSWTCILAVLLQQTTDKLRPTPFPSDRALEGSKGGPRRDANHFLVPVLVLRDAAMFSSVLQQLLLICVSAKTCTVAGRDLVWEIGVCCSSWPFLLPRKKLKRHSELMSSLCLPITFSQVLSPGWRSGWHYVPHMQVMEEMEICFQLCEQLHYALE